MNPRAFQVRCQRMKFSACIWQVSLAEFGDQLLHMKLIHRFNDRCGAQGAWMLPRMVKRLVRSWNLIG